MIYYIADKVDIERDDSRVHISLLLLLLAKCHPPSGWRVPHRLCLWPQTRDNHLLCLHSTRAAPAEPGSSLQESRADGCRQILFRYRRGESQHGSEHV